VGTVSGGLSATRNDLCDGSVAVLWVRDPSCTGILRQGAHSFGQIRSRLIGIVEWLAAPAPMRVNNIERDSHSHRGVLLLRRLRLKLTLPTPQMKLSSAIRTSTKLIERRGVKPSSARDVLRQIRGLAKTVRNSACPSCGLALVYFEVRLSLFGGHEAATFPLGFCRYCDGLPAAAGLVH
jgi:hypothetical protein